MASLKARSRLDGRTLAPEDPPLGALSTALSIRCASEGKRNMTADWSPELCLFRKGEPPPLRGAHALVAWVITPAGARALARVLELGALTLSP